MPPHIVQTMRSDLAGKLKLICDNFSESTTCGAGTVRAGMVADVRHICFVAPANSDPCSRWSCRNVSQSLAQNEVGMSAGELLCISATPSGWRACWLSQLLLPACSA